MTHLTLSADGGPSMDRTIADICYIFGICRERLVVGSFEWSQKVVGQFEDPLPESTI